MFYTFAIKDVETDDEVMPRETIEADCEENAQLKMDESLAYRNVTFVRTEIISVGETNGNKDQPTL